MSHPNAGNTLRLGTSVLQIGGGVVAILAPDATLATKVIGTYSVGVGSDEALAAIQGLITGEHIRSSREEGIDYFTQNQQTRVVKKLSRGWPWLIRFGIYQGGSATGGTRSRLLREQPPVPRHIGRLQSQPTDATPRSSQMSTLCFIFDFNSTDARR